MVDRDSQYVERRSKRLWTFSTKLDGRYHYDKKTKLLVGHPPTPFNLKSKALDPEERYLKSLEKLKGHMY